MQNKLLVLREFLYVDTDRVRSLLAQIEDGVPEESRAITKDEKLNEMGVKGFVGHRGSVAVEDQLSKSMADAIFPQLEEILESHGFLKDVSDLVCDAELWGNSEIQDKIPLGAMIRITSKGTLFDSRYVAEILGGFAATLTGLDAAGVFRGSDSARKPLKSPVKKNSGQSGRRNQKSDKLDTLHDTESFIPEISEQLVSSQGISSEYLRGIARVCRGMYGSGTHLMMRPIVGGNATISARLQDGRTYFDSDRDVLFSRYGSTAQEWTVVGTVGQHALPSPPVEADVNIVDSDDTINRSKMISLVDQIIEKAAISGFVDRPQPPGFTVVPLAVYRTVPAWEGF